MFEFHLNSLQIAVKNVEKFVKFSNELINVWNIKSLKESEKIVNCVKQIKMCNCNLFWWNGTMKPFVLASKCFK